jgi:hypothetical protein
LRRGEFPIKTPLLSPALHFAEEREKNRLPDKFWDSLCCFAQTILMLLSRWGGAAVPPHLNKLNLIAAAGTNTAQMKAGRKI